MWIARYIVVHILNRYRSQGVTRVRYLLDKYSICYSKRGSFYAQRWLHSSVSVEGAEYRVQVEVWCFAPDFLLIRPVKIREWCKPSLATTYGRTALINWLYTEYVIHSLSIMTSWKQFIPSFSPWLLRLQLSKIEISPLSCLQKPQPRRLIRSSVRHIIWPNTSLTRSHRAHLYQPYGRTQPGFSSPTARLLPLEFVVAPFLSPPTGVVSALPFPRLYYSRTSHTKALHLSSRNHIALRSSHLLNSAPLAGSRQCVHFLVAQHG